MMASHLFVLVRSALVAISVRAGVDGVFGRVGLEWVSQLKTFTSLDGAVYLHHGQSLKVVLNTPEDVMDVLTFKYEHYLHVLSNISINFHILFWRNKGTNVLIS